MRRGLFTRAELAVLRASDHVVDQQEPGGVLEIRDRRDRREAVLEDAAINAWREQRRQRGAA